MPSTRALAVWLREAEWVLADAAHRLPAGHYGTAEQAALADVLDRLAHAVRLHAGLVVSVVSHAVEP
ncbi:hypothetical protein [Gandjariella thermophila]|uniref:hypothetical protein n=1 Tax=Gandjariella thermophila TaxID=1931992 RepID=UPI0010F70F6D|nr:hypothetical protein [Gandjariella thermophila]